MRAVELLVPAGALLAVLVVAAVLRRRRPTGLPPEIERLLEAVPGALGDAVLVLDGAGRVVRMNAAAALLAGAPPADVLGRPVAVLGPDLPMLARGLSRGTTTALVTVAARSGPRRVRAALLRVGPDVDVIVLRTEAPARPPPLPRRAPPAAPRLSPDRAPPDVTGAAAAAAAVREPLARATRAASLLRLSAPPLGVRADAALEALGDALAEAEHRLAVLAGVARPAARHPLDLRALVEDVAVALRARVRLRGEAGPVLALGDDRALRSALREVLRALSTALPAQEELALAVSDAGGEAAVELHAAAPVPADVRAMARALLASHGALAEGEGPAGGWRLRLALPAAAVQAGSGAALV